MSSSGSGRNGRPPPVPGGKPGGAASVKKKPPVPVSRPMTTKKELKRVSARYSATAPPLPDRKPPTPLAVNLDGTDTNPFRKSVDGGPVVPARPNFSPSNGGGGGSGSSNNASVGGVSSEGGGGGDRARDSNPFRKARTEQSASSGSGRPAAPPRKAAGTPPPPKTARASPKVSRAPPPPRTAPTTTTTTTSGTSDDSATEEVVNPFKKARMEKAKSQGPEATPPPAPSSSVTTPRLQRNKALQAQTKFNNSGDTTKPTPSMPPRSVSTPVFSNAQQNSTEPAPTPVITVPTDEFEDANAPVRLEGFLQQRAEPDRGGWKKRLYQLKGISLVSFDGKKATSDKEVNTIRLVPGTEVTRTKVKGKKYTFDVSTPAATFVFAASNDAELMQWVSAVALACSGVEMEKDELSLPSAATPSGTSTAGSGPLSNFWRNPDLEGWLYKQGGGDNMAFAKRYFRLCNDQLFAFTDEKSNDPLGIIRIGNAKITRAPAQKKKAFCFHVDTAQHVYCFAADDESDMQRWIVAVSIGATKGDGAEEADSDAPGVSTTTTASAAAPEVAERTDESGCPWRVGIEREGFLYAREASKKKWRERYYRLCKCRLFVFGGEEATRLPQGVIELSDAVINKRSDKKKNYVFSVEREFSGSILLFSASDEADYLGWITSLNLSITDHRDAVKESVAAAAAAEGAAAAATPATTNRYQKSLDSGSVSIKELEERLEDSRVQIEQLVATLTDMVATRTHENHDRLRGKYETLCRLVRKLEGQTAEMEEALHLVVSPARMLLDYPNEAPPAEAPPMLNETGPGGASSPPPARTLSPANSQAALRTSNTSAFGGSDVDAAVVNKVLSEVEMAALLGKGGLPVEKAVEYAPLFLENDIDSIQVLKFVNSDSLREMGITKIGHIAMIRKAIDAALGGATTSTSASAPVKVNIPTPAANNARSSVLDSPDLVTAALDMQNKLKNAADDDNESSDEEEDDVFDGKKGTALYDFTATREDGLSLKTGDTVVIISDCGDGWSWGAKGDRVGAFPTAYVSLGA